MIGSIAEPPPPTRRTAEVKSSPPGFGLSGDTRHPPPSPPATSLRARLRRIAKDQHADLRMAQSDLQRSAEPFVAVRRRQPDLDDCDVHHPARRWTRAHPHPRTVKPRPSPLRGGDAPRLPEAARCLRRSLYHGISARTRVPPPRGVQTASDLRVLRRDRQVHATQSPAHCPHRRCRHLQPRSGSSLTCPIWTLALLAHACLSTLVRLSATT